MGIQVPSSTMADANIRQGQICDPKYLYIEPKMTVVYDAVLNKRVILAMGPFYKWPSKRIRET